MSNAKAIQQIALHQTPHQIDSGIVKAVRGQYIDVVLDGTRKHIKDVILSKSILTVEVGWWVIVIRVPRVTHWIAIVALESTGSGSVPSTTDQKSPANVTATAKPYFIELSWSGSFQNKATYEIQHNSSASETGATTIKYEGSNFFYWCAPGTTRYFRVRSVSPAFKRSAWSSWVNATATTGSAYMFLGVNAAGTAPIWTAFSWTDVSGVTGASMAHTHQTAAQGGQLDWDGVWADAVHDHSSDVEGGEELRGLLELDLAAATELTISGGVVTQTQAYHRIDTEADADTDDLDTITAGPGGFLIIRPEDNARTVVVKHNTGNIWIPAGSDITLDDVNDAGLLFYDTVLTKWLFIGWVSAASGGGGLSVHDHSTDAQGGQNLRQIVELELNDATTLTISAGAITRTQSYHLVDTEDGAATDDLDTISGGVEGDILILQTVVSTRDVVVRHNVGNIWLSGQQNITLDNVNDMLILFLGRNGMWSDTYTSMPLANIGTSTLGAVLIGDGTQIVADTTPTFVGLVTMNTGLTFGGASAANIITVPDNVLEALNLRDAGGLEYVRVVSTDTSPNLSLFPAGGGSVCIGTSAAASGYRLDIRGGNIGCNGALMFTDSSGVAYQDNWIGRHNDGAVDWLHIGGITTGGVRRIGLWASRTYFSGNVGIGTTAPGTKLDVRMTGASAVNVTVGQFFATDLGNGYWSRIIIGKQDAIADAMSFGFTEAALDANTYGWWVIGGDNVGAGINLRKGGDVGIGTPTPVTKLSVRVDGDGANPVLRLSSILQTSWTAGYGPRLQFHGGNDDRAFGEIGSFLQYTGNGGYTYMAFSTRSSEVLVERMRITSVGNVGIGTTSPSYQLQLSTDSAAKPLTNTWTIASDRKLKKKIKPFNDGLDVLQRINPVSYVCNGLAGMPADIPGIGVIPQDIQSVIPYTVGTFKAKLNPDDEEETELLSFNSHALTFVLINAVKELEARIRTLEEQLR